MDPKMFTQLLDAKLYSGAYKLSHSWKFGCCPLTMRNSHINLYRFQSQHFKRSTFIGPSMVYTGEFLKVNAQPNFEEWLCLHLPL